MNETHSPVVQAERALLGAILSEPSLFPKLSLLIRASDFSQPKHVAVWTALSNLAALGDPLDAITLCAHLDGTKQLVLVGGPSYLAEIEGETSTTANVDAYAKLVRAASDRRAIYEVAKGLAGDAKDFLLDPGDAAASAVAALDKLEHDAAVANQFEFTSGRALLDEPETKQLWLVNGLLPEAGVAVIAGEPKAVKTWAAIELAMAIATATPAFGRYEARDRRRVALFMAEDSKRSLRTRLRVLAGTRNMDPAEAADWMSIKCRGELNLLSPREVRYLIESCRAIPNLGLLVLDPLRDLHNADENDSTAMAQVNRSLRGLRDAIGCSVLFVHHSAKSSDATKDRRPGQKMRGSSAIHGAVDAGLYLTDTDTDLKSRWTSKLNAEIKEGAGCGKVKLTLRLDNVDGVAKSGAWEIETSDEERQEKDDRRQQQEEAKKARAEAAHEALVAKLVAALTDQPQASRTLRAMVRASARLVDEALETARCKGLAKQAWQGARCSGWTLNFEPAAGKKEGANRAGNGASKGTVQTLSQTPSQTPVQSDLLDPFSDPFQTPSNPTPEAPLNRPAPTRTDPHSNDNPVRIGVSAPLTPAPFRAGVRACITESLLDKPDPHSFSDEADPNQNQAADKAPPAAYSKPSATTPQKRNGKAPQASVGNQGGGVVGNGARSHEPEKGGDQKKNVDPFDSDQSDGPANPVLDYAHTQVLVQDLTGDAIRSAVARGDDAELQRLAGVHPFDVAEAEEEER